MKKKQVKMMTGATYEKIDDEGLHITLNDGKDKAVIEVDNVVICAGQISEKTLFDPLVAAGVKVTLIGGASVAAELDAKRAINQASRLAAVV